MTMQQKTRSLGTVAVCALGLASGAWAVPSTTQYDNPVTQEPTTITSQTQAAVSSTTTTLTETTPTTTETTPTTTETTPKALVIPKQTKSSPPKGGRGVLGAAKGAITHALPSAIKVKGTLPFTGLDLSVVLIGGLGAAVAGFGLRRVARRRSS